MAVGGGGGIRFVGNNHVITEHVMAKWWIYVAKLGTWILNQSYAIII